MDAVTDIFCKNWIIQCLSSLPLSDPSSIVTEATPQLYPISYQSSSSIILFISYCYEFHFCWSRIYRETSSSWLFTSFFWSIYLFFFLLNRYKILFLIILSIFYYFFIINVLFIYYTLFYVTQFTIHIIIIKHLPHNL